LRIDTFKKFASTFRKTSVTGKRLGIHVRIFTLSTDDARDNEISSITSDLVAVLMQLTELRELLVYGTLASTALAITSQTCRSSLRNIRVATDLSVALITVHYLGMFTHLESLALALAREDDDEGDPDLADFAPWFLPHLQRLELLAEGHSVPTTIVNFFSLAAFPRLEDLVLDIDVSAVPDVFVLRKLASAFSLQRAEIILERQYYSHLLPYIRTKSLVVGRTPRSAKDLPPGVHTLHVNVSGGEDDFDFFKSVLEGQTSIKDITLQACTSWISEAESFDVDDEDAPRLLRLMVYASALFGTKGICLRDSEGAIVSDYFKRD
jgi:hypothetical protein